MVEIVKSPNYIDLEKHIEIRRRRFVPIDFEVRKSFSEQLPIFIERRESNIDFNRLLNETNLAILRSRLSLFDWFYNSLSELKRAIYNNDYETAKSLIETIENRINEAKLNESTQVSTLSTTLGEPRYIYVYIPPPTNTTTPTTSKPSTSYPLQPTKTETTPTTSKPSTSSTTTSSTTYTSPPPSYSVSTIVRDENYMGDLSRTSPYINLVNLYKSGQIYNPFQTTYPVSVLPSTNLSIPSNLYQLSYSGFLMSGPSRTLTIFEMK